MECSTQGNSFVVAWGQEWIPNQRVGGYLVSTRYINHMTPFSEISCIASRHIALPFLSLGCSHFTIVATTLFFFSVAIFPSYVIHAYFYVLTADVLYDLGTALEFVSPLCPQLFLEVAGLGNFAKVPILTCFAHCR